MKSGEASATKSRSVEDVHHLRLMALLRDMDRRLGRMAAAEALGIDHRTLTASLEGRDLSRRVRVALERALLLEGGSAAAKQRERVEALEGRMEGLEREMRGGRAAVEGEIKALREQHAQGMRRLELRMARLEARQGAAEPPGSCERPAVSVLERRRHPELVTRDPAPDDGAVYGVAWPLIDEWRRLWDGHPNKSNSLSWLVTEERIRELEVAMLEEHGLTLPPETQPLHGPWRRSQLNWRKQALHDTRRARARRELLRWVRRVLTLGLWWK